MLLEEFDTGIHAVINPDMVTEKIEDFPEVTISCFLKKCLTAFLRYLMQKRSWIFILS